MVSAPVLTLLRSGVRFTVTTDASNFAVGAPLGQEGRPVAYLSHRQTDTKLSGTLATGIISLFNRAAKVGRVFERCLIEA